MKNFTLTTIRKAGNAALKLFGKSFKVKYKNYQDVVTSADIASEKVLISAIRKAYPTHSILSEEAGKISSSSSYCWYLDPLDGTNNFFMGLPLWGVSMALYKENTPLAGASYFPLQNELYYAEKGKGAFLNGKRIRVSKKKDTRSSLLVFDDPRALDSFRTKEGDIKEFADKFFAVRVLGSACYTHALLAKGTIDACFHPKLKPGDFAAGKILIEEAGGRIEDVERNETQMERSVRFLATNGKLHAKIKRMLK
ncbi:inositol monophosphatase [Candidatus Micrarchaeota archaeon CG11_big_fil_rev_8_21_14_0_20_47_5]|nr:MAG: inositol monophosphatase [Candidatus Micrarchaeota archaeon CG11_big_fil_rev_8_21_14_0_20_47_5]